ncbi:Sec-independent protein translocase subunit TatA [Psychrobacter urativorans]|uniref:Sec-independent protein translocase protein TatA n=1 Tax=Psychrobacter urativorans TaxID=45610 RepID=A0A0M4T7G3_9GAMM|nr:Sec-independent protein translocase subunit TatA [Psychrobacter urativorans]ALF59584.1 preprotein translocase subunit TatA [Psychrobacter urativorans]
MGSFSITHWLILLVVVVVIFGTSKLKNAGKDLGGAVKGFKEAVNDEQAEHKHKHKRRVLDHKVGSPVQDEQSGTRIDDIKISPAPADDQHKV